MLWWCPRLLVDTEGVAGVPVDGGRTSTTNNWGYGVVTDINSYYRNGNNDRFN